MSSPAAAPEPPAADAARRPVDRSVVPDRSGDDLDVGWGERAADTADDDERFLRERPPHWE